MDAARELGPGIPERLDNFQLLERLGAGGMGVVFRARDEVLDRDVALKLILPENLYFEEARERFRREVEAAAKLHHPGIVPVYSVGEEHGLPFFAMELVEGSSLAAIIEHLRERETGALTGADLREAIFACTHRFDGRASSTEDSSVFSGTWVQACCRLSLQVADALHHAHERGVLHRDIKPSNILVTPSGRAMLVDFGLASTADASSRITRTGSQAGSMPYLPPERVHGGLTEADRRGDVYALGVSLYELLALRLPFEGKTPQELFASIASGACAPLRSLNAAVPWDASVVCATAMERDPARRYATADAFAHDLRNLLELRPIVARPAGTTLRFRRWVQRNPTLSVASALGFLLLVVAPSVAWWRIKRERDRALQELSTKEGMLNFVLDLFSGADTEFGNPGDRTVYELLDSGAERIASDFDSAPEVRGRLLLDLGVLQGKLGRPREAVELLRQAQTLLLEVSGPDDRHLGRAKRALGVELLLLGEIDEGTRLLDEGTEILSAGEGADSRAAVEAEMDSSMALIQSGNFAEARARMERLATTPAWQRNATPVLRMIWFTNVAQTCRGLGDQERAIELYRRALELSRQTYGEVHNDVARALQDLAVAQLEMGDNEEALARLVEAREVRARLQAGDSMEDARLDFNLGTTYGKLQRHAESAESYGRALEACRKLAGDSAQTSKAAAGKGLALLKLGRAEEAEPVLREAVDLSRRFIPRRGRPAADAPLCLARCLIALGRADEAAPLFEEVLEVTDGDPAVAPELEAKWHGELADVLEATGRDEDAAAHRERQHELLDGAEPTRQ